MNLLEEVTGKLSEDKEAMLGVIDRYLGLTDEKRLLFRLELCGKVLTALAELNDLAMRYRLQSAIRELSSEAGGDFGEPITESVDQYIKYKGWKPR